MQVTDKIFYHIHTIGCGYDKFWSLGEKFNVGHVERNGYLKYYDTANIGMDCGNGLTIPMREATKMYRLLPIEAQHKHLSIYLQQAEKAFKEMGTYIRETIFEEVRRDEFPFLPSRFKGIWVCEEKDIQHWWNKVQSGEKAIFRVSLTGVIHRANPVSLVSECIEHNLLRENARLYWNAKNLESALAHELLFQGDVFVLEQL